MSITEIARIQTSDGDEFATLVGPFADAIRTAPGCIGATSGRCLERPDDFVLVIEWDDVAAHEAFQKTPTFREFVGRISHLMVAAPDVSHYEMTTS